MAAKGGCAQGVFTLTGADTVTLDDSVTAPQVITPPAGDYTPRSLWAYLQAQAAGGLHWSLTLSDGESGTGKGTIDTSDRPFSVTWSSANMRTLMGFAANIVAVSAAQVGGHCRGLWLPGVAKWTPHGDDDGNGNAATRRSSARDMISPTGAVKTLAGSSYYDFRGIRWEGVLRQRAKLIGEVVPNESFERFWGDVYLADFAMFTAGSKVRLYWDADLSTYTTVRIVSLRDFDPVRMRDGWVGRYNIELPRLVKV